jgi:hypothetical protein
MNIILIKSILNNFMILENGWKRTDPTCLRCVI